MNWNLLLIWATEVENINDLNRELGRHLEGNKLTSLRRYGGYIGNARNGELTWRIIAPASEGREPVVGYYCSSPFIHKKDLSAKGHWERYA